MIRVRSRRVRYRLARPRLLVTVLLAAAAITLLWLGLLAAVAVLFPEPVVAGFGTIEIGRWVETAVARREEVVPAPRDGWFARRYPDGERIARRGVLGTLRSPGRGPWELRARFAGLVAYSHDGLEQKLTPALALADPAEALSLARKGRVRAADRGTVRRGQPIARLVDDLEQYLVVPLEKPPSALAVGDRIWAREQEDLIPLSVARIAAWKRGICLVLRTERFPRPWLAPRCPRVYLVLGRYTGTLVPRRLLKLRQGQQGVMAMVRGRPKFVAVGVLGQDRHQAAVTGIKEGAILAAR